MNLNQFGLRSSSLTSRKQFQKAISAGCTEIQPVTELLDYGVTNAIFSDTFHYNGCCIMAAIQNLFLAAASIGGVLVRR